MTFKELIGDNKITVTKIPEHCTACPFSTIEDDILMCVITGDYQKDYTEIERMKGCPLRLKQKRTKRSSESKHYNEKWECTGNIDQERLKREQERGYWGIFG